MTKSSTALAVLFVSTALLGSSEARADFVIDNVGGWQTASTSLNITSQTAGVTSFSGTVGAQTIGITTDVSVDTASGNAVISAHNDATAPLRLVTFILAGSCRSPAATANQLAGLRCSAGTSALPWHPCRNATRQDGFRRLVSRAETVRDDDAGMSKCGD